VPEPDDEEEDEDEDEEEEEPDPAPSEPVFAGAGPSSLEEPPSDPPEDEDFRPLDPRSFFAQPEPLKWIVGAVNALRTSWLPQTGQAVGPASLTP
jgi:hypothetical protein